VALRFNPPPGWPTPPQGFVPDPGWQPDPSWPAVPPGWQFWAPDDASATPTGTGTLEPSTPAGAGWEAPGTQAGAGDGAPEPSAGAGDAAPGTSAEAGSWRPPGAAPTAYGQPGGAAPAAYGQPGGAAPAAYGQPGGAAPTAYGQPGPGWAVPAPPSETSGMAIAAFVLGLLGFLVITAILGVVLGAQALGHIRRSPQGGRTLATLGIIFGGLWLVVLVALIGISATSGNSSPGTPPRTSGSNVPTRQSVPVTSLVTGDCYDIPVQAGTHQELRTVEKLQCTRPHNSQVFATFSVSGSSFSYPGSAKLGGLAERGCAARVTENVDNTKVTDSMGMRWLYPGQASWLAGTHIIECFVYSPTSISSSVLKR
jgi:hypothetical protein